MIIAGTGHRPDKLGGYDHKTFVRLVDLAITALREHKPSLVISGMALGWDQALATAADHIEIPYHAYVPFKDQDSRWPATSRQHYQYLLNQAEEIKICCPGGYASWKMQQRNMDMVDDCTHVLALWNGDPTGGTANCVRYAQLQEKPIINLWEQWCKSKP